MHIKFKEIKIKNFLSLGNADIKLENQGYTLVSGINNNIEDLAKSNGSGKSSIFEAIVWALTGETIRGTKDIVNNKSTTGAKIELLFDIDNNTYRVVRTKDDDELGTNLKIFINNEDKSGKGIRDGQELLEKYLPDLNSNLLGSVIILGQGLPQRFTNNTPSGRKEVLEKLSKSDYMIEDIKDKLSNRKTKLNEELRKYEDLILSGNSKKSILENQLQKLKNDKTLLVPLDNYDNEIKNNEDILNRLLDSQTETYNYSLQLNEKLNQKLDEYQKWVASVNSNIESETIHIEENSGISEIAKKLDELTIESNSKYNEILKLENIKDVCPTCGQHLPDVHKVDTTELHKELDLLREQINKLQETYTSMRSDIDKKVEKLKEDLNKETENIKKEGTELRETLNKVNEENQSYLKEIKETELILDKLKLNKENNINLNKTIDEDIVKCETDIKQLSDELLYNNIEKDNINKHIEVVSKMTTIATRDFRGFLLSEIISFINTKAKEYSSKIFETDKVEFTLNGNNINISYCEKEYENLSGGEKQKVDLIIQFSIRDMLCQFLDFSSNILALDEIFDNLDSIGSQKVLDLISHDLTDIESVFIITHHASELLIPNDNEIIVVKNENGISEIQ